MAWRVAQEVPGVRRVTPAYGKDWNERLVQDREQGTVVQVPWDKQVMRSLWNWHQVAQNLEHSKAYLTRITEVARSVVQGEDLPERAKVAMERDFHAISQQQKPSEQRQRSGGNMSGKEQKLPLAQNEMG